MIKAFYRLTKPGIIYGNLLTTAGGFLLASKGHVDLGLLLATLAGTSLIIASGCVFNNYLDRGIDKKMARTRKRALVSGLISTRSAILYGTMLGLLGILILYVEVSPLVVGIGLSAWFFYVVVYGIAKRRSVHGTLIGTIPGATPPLAGYIAVTNHFDLGALLLFLIMVCWQMAHFYAIALYRLKDYRAAGLPVLPAVKGVKTTRVHILAYIAAFITATVLFGIFGYGGFIFMTVMVLFGLRWFWLGAVTFDGPENNTYWARKMFFFSLIVITTLSAMLSINAWLIYNLGMLLLIHVVVALLSLGYATYLFISPTKSRFPLAYGLTATTLITGTYLVWNTGAHMLQACTMGLLYTGFVSVALVSAHRKLIAVGNK